MRYSSILIDLKIHKNMVASDMKFDFKLASGCNIGSLFAVRGKLSLKFTLKRHLLAGTSTCPNTLFNKGEFIYCEYSALIIIGRAGQVRVLFCLPDSHFLPNSLATCSGASGYVARWAYLYSQEYMREEGITYIGG